MGNAQYNRHLTAQVANQIDSAITHHNEASGFHFFTVNGSPALGHGLAIIFVVLMITVMCCCFFRCRHVFLKHLSVRNAVRTFTERAPSWASASAPQLPFVAPTASAAPIAPASAPIILHATAASPMSSAPPQYELTPLAHSKAYNATSIPNSGVPYGV